MAQPSSALVQVTEPPPPARVEILPVDPGGGTVYVDGEWTWRRGRWAWTAGRWVQPPPKASFSPWAFVRGPDGLLWCAPGVWRDPSGNAIGEPAPISVASVETGAVVLPSGETTVTGPVLRRHPVRPAGAGGANAGPDGGPGRGPAPPPAPSAPAPSTPPPH